MNDSGILATYLMFLLSKNTNPEIINQFKLIKDHNPNRVNDLLIHNTIPITLHDNLLTFRNSGKVFGLTRDLLEMINDENYNVDLASLADEKILSDFAKEMKFDLKTICKNLPEIELLETYLNYQI